MRFVSGIVFSALFIFSYFWFRIVYWITGFMVVMRLVTMRDSL